MEQLSLFDQKENKAVVIPEDVISPLESSKSVKSKEFKKQQMRWREWVMAVQATHNCSWFEARKLLLEHRNSQRSIAIKLVE
ncbi:MULTISPECIES: hypothetical protein [Clostridia]|uniref:hypothetical protein n=1 Tax=Clostridia TaxID=186801 RepID=UPI000EA04B5A|nr:MULTISPECIES: hypothetical protein [Clostridia]NBJ68886.1 hypothetical protein [Roseburia sp. 1XD42-34]RKI80260.1 hypothetical protein D7V87_05260 [Clostridium sp. 1xD42-85]